MSIEIRTRIRANGRLTIARVFRKALRIREGDHLVLRLEDDGLLITTLKQRIERAQGLVRKHVKPGTSLATELIAERRNKPGNSKG